MAFERLIRVAQLAWHAVRMGLITAIVALGSIALWAWGNRPERDWAEALVADLADGPRPVTDFAPDDWQQVCGIPAGLDPVTALAEAGGPVLLRCDGWQPWYRYYPEVAALAFVGDGGCTAYPVAEDILTVADGTAVQCLSRRGFTLLTLDTEAGVPRLTVTHR